MEAIPDACLDSLVIAGTPPECRARLSAYGAVLDEMLLLNVMAADAGNVVLAYQPLMQLPAMLSAAARA